MTPFEKQMKELSYQLEKHQNEVIAKFPAYKQKGYMGENIVLMDFTPSNFKEAQVVANSLNEPNIRINIYQNKNRIALIF
jgi:hypothetical protein